MDLRTCFVAAITIAVLVLVEVPAGPAVELSRDPTVWQYSQAWPMDWLEHTSTGASTLGRRECYAIPRDSRRGFRAI